MNKILVLLASCLLCSCFTDFYRKPLWRHEVFAGWEVAPKLYRAGDEGYVEGRQVQLQSIRPGRFYVRSYEGRLGYHRVSSEMQKELLESAYVVSGNELARALKKSGGAWLPKLPRAAAGRATKLDSPPKLLVGRRIKRAAWYRYALSGIAFVCADVPLNVAGDAAVLVTIPLWFPMAWYLARPMSPPAKPSPKES